MSLAKANDDKASAVLSTSEAPVLPWPWLDTRSKLVEEKQVKEDDFFQYLGTGGILISMNGEAVLADPFFSNPSIADLLLLKDLAPKTEIIDEYLPPLDNLKGLLLGHGHYDHIMDVPYIAKTLPKDTKVLGSQTVVNQLISSIKTFDSINVNPILADYDTKLLTWVYLSEQLRVMPLMADHAPHFAGILVAGGQVLSPLSSMPRDVLDWQCGIPVGYLLEWTSKRADTYRVLYLSSSAAWPKGVPPKIYLEELRKKNAGFDLVLLSAANFVKSANYPRKILQATRPQQVVMLHWEKFWQPFKPGSEEAVRTNEVSEFIRIVEETAPQATLYLPRRMALLPLSPSIKSKSQGSY
ncbi:MAG: hypothetical protein MI867_23035 [Pseudomonadales bacterium]|nr:hypothetical protein [Pseudomonadales bacterium]